VECIPPDWGYCEEQRATEHRPLEMKGGSTASSPGLGLKKQIRVSALYFHSFQSENRSIEEFMPTDTHKIDNNEVIETLHDVIESLIDGQEGFQKIGEHLKDETLKKYFFAESLKRSQFRGELETLLHTTGDHDPKESGSVSGALHRTWGDIKAHLGGNDHTFLETTEQGEDAAKKAYKDALQKDLPMPVKQLLTTQYEHIQKSHDYVKAARDSRK
jgi:uncharacterized protein (TIGR02284 family)